MNFVILFNAKEVSPLPVLDRSVLKDGNYFLGTYCGI